MRKLAIMSAAVVLMSSIGMACSESVTRSEKSVQEKTSYSSSVQDNRDRIGEQRYDSTTMEQKQRTTTSDDIAGSTTTREKVTTKERQSEIASPDLAERPLGAAQEYNEKSETFRQHTTTEVTK